MEIKDIVKFSRLLYVSLNYYNYVIEFEVNGELKLWYNLDKLDNLYNSSPWEKPYFFNEELSDHCILQKQKELKYLFLNSPITHF